MRIEIFQNFIIISEYVEFYLLWLIYPLDSGDDLI